MIYFMKINIVIRRMQETDPQIFSNEKCAQGRHASPEKYDMRISDEKKGISVALTAEYQIVCIGVGLHAGYGSAQRMYVKRGYIPDGTGVW